MPTTLVQQELGRIAADYRKFLILKGLTVCWLAAAVAGLLMLAAFWLFGFSHSLVLGFLLALTLVGAFQVLLRHRRTKVDLRELARRVEKDDPRLNTLLLAALEQEPDPNTGRLSFLQLRVLQEALEANRKSPWRQKFTERLFFMQGIQFSLLGCVGLVFYSLAMIAPRTGGVLVSRDSIQVTPGNSSLEKGSAVAIMAQLRRPVPGGVRLVYISPEGGEKKVDMARSLNDPLYGFTLPSLLEETKYYVEYDGERSEDFILQVFEYPELKRADAELNFPAYTGLAASKIEDTRRITAVEGTGVDYTFYLNKPVRSARLRGTNEVEMLLSNTIPDSVSYALSFPLKESGRFKLELIDEDGRTNKLPTDFVFVALRNEAPKLKLQSPRGDQRVSALQEVRFEAEAQDDFGLRSFGIAYSMPGRTSKEVDLSAGMTANAHETKKFTWTLPIESLEAEPGELISYYLWADDLGPDGLVRRNQSDIYFAEVRPFEEIFREGQGDQSSSGQQQQQQQEQQNPATKLMELQKEIVTATWNLQRRENKRAPSPAFKEDATVIHDSQQSALQQALDLKEELRDDKSRLLADEATQAMEAATESLSSAAAENTPKMLAAAQESEQAAYQALLKLQAREYQVSRSRSSNSRGQSQANQRAQRQLEQLEFKEDENRYETESEASALQTPEQRETLQVLNRLKELARRQEDMSERLKELQTALNEAQTQKEREELDRQLKRLQEEQQQIVQDMDEVRQRMAQPENQSRMAEAREQLDQTRQQSREAAQKLEDKDLSQALSSSSRAQEELKQLSDDFRRATSNQFSEEMRQMRQQARELEEKQKKVAQKMEEMKESKQRSLGEVGPRKEAIEALAEQRAGLTNLLQNMRQVTEQAETAEPLLSRQLYETLRRSSQANPEKALELSSQLLERNFLPQASETQQKVGETIRDLTEGVERAARSVLGDEAESLRFAQKELQDLADRAEQEMTRFAGMGQTNVLGETGRALENSKGTNRTNIAGQTGATNQLATARYGNRPPEDGGMNPQGSQAGQAGDPTAADGQRQGSGQASSEQPAQNGGESQTGGEVQPGLGSETRARAQSGQQPGQGQQGAQGEQGSQGEGRGRDGSTQTPGGGGGSGGSFFEQWARAGREEGNPNGGTPEGPLTGADYTRWSDRLRDIEEVLQDPELRSDVGRVREQARTMRAEFKRHSELPQWDLVEAEVIKPLRIIQNRVAEELARQNSREAVVPVDRDPVPQKYADAVNRYYERLGKE